MMSTLSHFGGSIPWSPLVRGLLKWAGLFTQGYADKIVVDRLEEVATRLNASMAQTVLAWLAAKPGVTAPIIGTSSIEPARSPQRCVMLSTEYVKYLDEPYKPKPIAGHA